MILGRVIGAITSTINHPFYDAKKLLVVERTDAAGAPLADYVIAVDTVAANVRAAEAALKGTPVELIEIRLADAGLSGKGVSIYQGDLSDIEAAIDMATRQVGQAGVTLRHRIIAAPHDALIKQIETSTWYGSQTVLGLDGEVV